MRRLAIAALVGLLAGGSGQPSAAASRADTAAPRQIVSLKDGWRFHQGDETGPEAAAFPDAAWTSVSVPHTWNRVGQYLPPSRDRVNTPATLNSYQGVAWYRLHFTPPKAFAGKRAWLQFDAASRTAEVWLNGVRLGGHKGGFSRFRLDATAALKPGQPNVLAVKVDNTAPAPGTATADVLPLTGDFFVQGGLYRPVSLIATDRAHIDMLDEGGPGVYAHTASVAGRSARIEVRSRVSNDGGAATPLVVVARLVDARGRTAAEQARKLVAPAGEVAPVEHTLAVRNPHLWQGVEDPYLYRLVVDVKGAGGRTLDHLEQTFGVRQMRFDPARGFLLNGKPLRLKGVGYHQDREGTGWASSAADVAEDVATIRDMGANTIRLTHYQHGQAIHDLADRYGLILWDEIPLVSAWTLGGRKEPTSGLVENARQQLRELIHQNSNHPSVAVWSIANELDLANRLPFAGGANEATGPDATPLLKVLNDTAHAEDPSRPTTQAVCCEGVYPNVPVVAGVTDLAGANRYYGWYYGSVDELGERLDTIHATRPLQPLAVTEYGAGGAVTMHTDDPLGAPPDSRGRAQPEEYESYIHERAWATLRSKPYLWATWLWNSFDFATTVRHEGDSDDVNTKGLITYDRLIKKDAFYFYRANWSPDPTVHINGRRYVDRAYAVTDVRVYSNAPSTEFTLNGRSLGRRDDCPDKVCVWKDVRLEAGENKLLATGRFAAGPTRDAVSWTLGADPARNVRIDSGALLSVPAANGFGSDAFFEGGRAATTNTPAPRGQPASKRTIQGAADPTVAATYREGDFRYRIPLPNGAYTVKLTFVEPSAAAGERQFDVLANGERVLPGLDVAAAAGGPLKALTRTLPVQVTTGRLDLQFAPTKGAAIVSAVEVEGR